MEHNSSSKHKQLFADLQIGGTPKHTIHVEWKALSDTFTALLSGILDREIRAYAEREEYYYWNIAIREAPITQEELEIIFALAGADILDRETNDYGEYPIMELCQGLCSKLINKLLPYGVDYTLADDEGVWFIGDLANIVKQSLPDGTLLVAETEDDPEYPGIRISARIPGQLETLICFVEHNSAKPAGRELCIGAYSADQDEPAYYESYNDPGSVSPNV